MKFVFALVLLAIMAVNRISARAFLDKLFSGYDNSYGYGNSYGGYPNRPRSYGRSYGYNDEGDGNRYKAICRVHAIDSFAFPGRVGNPVCPY